MAADDAKGSRFFGRDSQDRGNLFDRRFTAELDGQLPAHPLDGGQHANLVAGNANGTSVVRQSTGNTLPDPPGGVGAKLETQPVFVFIHSPHQTAVSFLDEVGKRQAAPTIS